jgi:single-strand DNA-binding protein
MFNFVATNAIISKGYNGEDAIKFSRTDDKITLARFKCGVSVYDSKSDDNKRWINFTVKAFNNVAKRVESMKLHEGSHVNLSGRVEQESYTGQDGKTLKNFVFYAEDVEYASYTEKKEQSNAPRTQQPAPQQPSYQPVQQGYQAAPQQSVPQQQGYQPMQQGYQVAPQQSVPQQQGYQPMQQNFQSAPQQSMPQQQTYQSAAPQGAWGSNGGFGGYYDGAAQFQSEADAFMQH